MGALFNKNQRKSCEYCSYGVKSDFSNEIFCNKKGVVSSNGVCRKYKYDVLKRTPKQNKISNNYSPEDFKL